MMAVEDLVVQSFEFELVLVEIRCQDKVIIAFSPH
jgi:hypothetical protein